MRDLQLSPYISGLFDSDVGFLPLLNRIPIAILVLTRDRRIAYLNRAAEALTGTPQEMARGLPCRHVLRSNVCHMGCPFLNMGPESVATCVEGNIINRDRQKIPIRGTFQPIKDVSGNLVGFMETLEDIRALQQLDAIKGQAYFPGGIIGHSPEMERIFNILPGIAQTDSSVLITGETGTGKDVLAEAIHQASKRSKGPFIKVNCGALPETLLESELFGHRKGAFTGAMEDKPGRFKLAHNGTLFLTEVGDLPLPLQVKLLTFLDDQIIFPLGSTKGVPVDVRIIAATHRNLEDMVHKGTFRQDLLFRLNVVRLEVPPLRVRGDDVRLLIDHFLHYFVTELKLPIKGFSEKAMGLLLEYHYPGNVRELRNIVEYAVNICRDEHISSRHLPDYMHSVPIPTPASSSFAPAEQASPAPPRSGIQTPADADWPSLEKSLILDALLKTKGRKNEAAEILGWSRSKFWRKMKQHGINS